MSEAYIPPNTTRVNPSTRHRLEIIGALSLYVPLAILALVIAMALLSDNG